MAIYNFTDLTKMGMPGPNIQESIWNIPVAASGTTYIARYTGYIFAFAKNAKICNLHNNVTRISSVDFVGGYIQDRYGWIPVTAGDVFSFFYEGTVHEFKNIPAIGAIDSPI